MYFELIMNKVLEIQSEILSTDSWLIPNNDSKFCGLPVLFGDLPRLPVVVSRREFVYLLCSTGNDVYFQAPNARGGWNWERELERVWRNNGEIKSCEFVQRLWIGIILIVSVIVGRTIPNSGITDSLTWMVTRWLGRISRKN